MFQTYSIYKQASLPATNMKAENILQGDYTQLTFVIGVLKILVKYIYALNDDMTNCFQQFYGP